MVPKDGPGTAVHSCGACWWAGLLTTASKEDTPPWTECEYSERRYFCNALAMNGAERRRCYWVVVSTSQPGVFVMTAYQALIRPSGEDAMGRSCILDSPPAVRMPAAVWMPACHSRRFKGEWPIGAATGQQSQPPRPCANPPSPPLCVYPDDILRKPQPSASTWRYPLPVWAPLSSVAGSCYTVVARRTACPGIGSTHGAAVEQPFWG